MDAARRAALPAVAIQDTLQNKQTDTITRAQDEEEEEKRTRVSERARERTSRIAMHTLATALGTRTRAHWRTLVLAAAAEKRAEELTLSAEPSPHSLASRSVGAAPRKNLAFWSESEPCGTHVLNTSSWLPGATGRWHQAYPTVELRPHRLTACTLKYSSGGRKGPTRERSDHSKGKLK